MMRSGVQFLSILAVLTIWIVFRVSSTWRDGFVASRISHLRDEADYILSNESWNVTEGPKIRSYEFVISEAVANPDGVFRPMILINDMFPGPVIRANEGDVIVIEVENRGSNSTSIHWHGLFQNGTNWMDGAVGVTNCAIPPGGRFSYEFKAENQSGTYWYHAHLSTTRIDGVFGPLIIHSRNESAEYDTDAIVLIQDYYHDLSASLLPGYLEPGNENAEPTPDGALINGRNIIDCTKVSSRRQCNTRGLSLASLRLDPNKEHRLRFINVGAFAEFEVQIDEHDMSLIEVDGEPVRRHTINRFPIAVAQRYSFIISRPSSSTANSFFLRARMLPHCFASLDLPPHLDLEVRSTIHYAAHSPPPTTLPFPPSTASSLTCRDLNMSTVIPLNPQHLPQEPSSLIYLRANFEIGDYRLSRGFINSTRFQPSHTTSILQAILNGSRSPPSDESVFLHSPHVHKVVDIVIDNFDDGSHPFHLHGHRFWVLGSGEGYFSYEHPEMKRTLQEPESVLRRDTITVEPYRWVAVRVMLDNPGVWLLHCHTAWHLEAGMGAVMVVDGLRLVQQGDQGRKVAEKGCGIDVGHKWPGVMDEKWTRNSGVEES